jgi:hypothetical protein
LLPRLLLLLSLPTLPWLARQPELLLRTLLLLLLLAEVLFLLLLLRLPIIIKAEKLCNNWLLLLQLPVVVNTV